MSKFHYVYTAPTKEERKEIAAIRSQYEQTPTEDKLTQLRRLDKKVKNTANIVALSVGIIACLVFGAGMSMVLVWGQWFGGIFVSTIGILGMAVAYPLYRWLLARGKKKYGGEILRLSEELLAE